MEFDGHMAYTNWVCIVWCRWGWRRNARPSCSFWRVLAPSWVAFSPWVELSMHSSSMANRSVPAPNILLSNICVRFTVPVLTQNSYELCSTICIISCKGWDTRASVWALFRFLSVIMPVIKRMHSCKELKKMWIFWSGHSEKNGSGQVPMSAARAASYRWEGDEISVKQPSTYIDYAQAYRVYNV